MSRLIWSPPALLDVQRLGTGSVQFLIQVIDLKDYKSHGNKVVDLKKTMLEKGDGGQVRNFFVHHHIIEYF